MPACGRFDVKYSRTVPGQLVGEAAGQPPLGFPTNIVVDEATTCIVAVSVLLVVRLAVKPLVIRLAKPGGVAVATGKRNSTPPVEIVLA
jgi:hypothetical protein